ncbi:C1q-related factor-like [Diretmus argenteus]
MRALVFLCLLGTALSYSWNPTTGYSRTAQPPYRDIGSVCLTDQASCGCCLMQQQMNRMEMFFNESINKLQQNVDSTLTVLNNVRASRSAFSVSLTNARWCYGPLRTQETIVYQHIFINLGGNYDLGTGIFTVPRSGVYSFALTVYSDSGATNNSLAACAILVVNGETIARPRDRNQQDQEDSATIVVALQLNAGDRVSAMLPIGCFLCDNNSHFNTFTGYLLYATD